MRVNCLSDFLSKVVMSFHECGGNVGDDVCIPLPNWVAEIGRSNPDIFFTDREGRHNPECLSWGIDKERVLRGRTAIEVHPAVAVRLYLIISHHMLDTQKLFCHSLHMNVCFCNNH